MFVGAEEELCVRVTSLASDSRLTGTVMSAFKPGDEFQGMTLTLTDEFSVLSQWLSSPTRTYFDSKTGFVYELFTLQQVEQARSLMAHQGEDTGREL